MSGQRSSAPRPRSQQPVPRPFPETDAERVFRERYGSPASTQFAYEETALPYPAGLHHSRVKLVVADHLLAGAYGALHRAFVRGEKGVSGVRLPRHAREPLSLLVDVDTTAGPRRYEVTVKEVQS